MNNYIKNLIVSENITFYIPQQTPQSDYYSDHNLSCVLGSESCRKFKERAKKWLRENSEASIEEVTVPNGSFSLSLVSSSYYYNNGVRLRVRSKELSKKTKREVIILISLPDFFDLLKETEFIEHRDLSGNYFITECPYDYNPCKIRLFKADSLIKSLTVSSNLGRYKRRSVKVGNLCVSNTGQYYICLGNIKAIYRFNDNSWWWCRNGFEDLGRMIRDSDNYVSITDEYKDIIAYYPITNLSELSSGIDVLESVKNIELDTRNTPMRDLGVQLLDDIIEGDLEKLLRTNYPKLFIRPKVGWKTWLNCFRK